MSRKLVRPDYLSHQRFYLVNITKFLRTPIFKDTPILKNICERLLLCFQWQKSTIRNFRSSTLFQFLVYKWLRVTLGMMGKLCITLSFNAFYIWSVELYPTTVRYANNGLGKIKTLVTPLKEQFYLSTGITVSNYTEPPKLNFSSLRVSALDFQICLRLISQ